LSWFLVSSFFILGVMFQQELPIIAAFLVFVTVLLIIDLGLFNKKAHAITVKEAALMSVFWIGIALAFNVFVYLTRGPKAGTEYFTGWLLEKSLSVDNLFVFLVLFGFFGVEGKYQRRVLSWGIIGALVMRGIMIFLGTALIAQFNWIIYIFGVFLVYTGWKIMREKEEDEEGPDIEKNPAVRLVRKFIPMSPDYDGEHFFTKINGKKLATPLLLVLVVIETTDLAFAVDSIPAVMAVTQDPFIVFTSNIMAILGLRALYFLLASVLDKFLYLKPALGIILIFVGLKMLLEEKVLDPLLHITRDQMSEFTMIFVVVVLGIAAIASFIHYKRNPAPEDTKNKD